MCAHSQPSMPFLDHLGELRTRLIRCLIAVLVGFALCYPFAKRLFNGFSKPLRQAESMAGINVELIYTGPLEVFIALMKLSLICSLLLVVPYLFFELWGFIAPALKKQERRFVIPFVTLTSTFFIAGVAFGFFIVLPLAYLFFFNYAPEFIDPQIRVAEYFSITMRMLLAFGLLFELPVFMLLLIYLGVVKTRQLAKQWRLVVIVVSVLAALLTPADPMTMIFLALPLTALFFISLGFGLLLERRRR